MELSEIKNAAKEFRIRSKGLIRPRWPQEIRQAVVNFYNKGYSVKALSAATEIAHQTIATWVYNKKRKPGSNFKQVKLKEELSPEPKSKDIKLVYKEGLTIEGLSFENLKELLGEALL